MSARMVSISCLYIPIISWRCALSPLHVGAMVGGEFPFAGLADPRVAANHRASTECAVKGGVIGEFVVCDGGVVPESRHFNVADPAFGELDGLVLHLLDGVRLGRPLAPAVPLYVAVGQVLLI